MVIVLFLLPALVIFLLFVIYPIFRSVYYSTFDWKGLGAAVNNIGLENYKKILADEVFLKVSSKCPDYHCALIGAAASRGDVLAIMVGRDLPGRALFRTIFFLPYVLSEVNTGIMWMLLYNPDPERGFINGILVAIGFATRSIGSQI